MGCCFADAVPSVDGGWPTGNGVHAVLGTPPSPGTCISLRVPAHRRFSLEDCVASGPVTPGAAKLCALGTRRNSAISSSSLSVRALYSRIFADTARPLYRSTKPAVSGLPPGAEAAQQCYATSWPEFTAGSPKVRHARPHESASAVEHCLERHICRSAQCRPHQTSGPRMRMTMCLRSREDCRDLPRCVDSTDAAVTAVGDVHRPRVVQGDGERVV